MLKKMQPMMKEYAFWGAMIGLAIGILVGALAGGSNWSRLGGNLETTLLPMLGLGAVFAIYGIFMGMLLGSDAADRRQTNAHSAQKQLQATKASAKHFLEDQGWLFLDGKPISLRPGSTVIVVDNA